MYGKHHTYETRKKISESHKNKNIGINSPSAKKVIQYDLDGNIIKIWDCINDAQRDLKIKNIVSCCRRKPNYKTVGGYIWRYFGDELTKEDIIHCNERKGERRVIQYSLSGEPIQIFNSIREAELKTGVKYAGISKCCRKIRIKSGGFIWRYYEDDYEITI